MAFVVWLVIITKLSPNQLDAQKRQHEVAISAEYNLNSGKQVETIVNASYD